MKAVFKTLNSSNAKNLSGDKELIRSYNLIGCKDGEMREVATVRCWMGRSRSASTVYASIWTYGPWVSGHGKAGGYGYCKTSAAVGDAIRSAGIELNQDINGRGESAIRDALRAIGEEMGYSNLLIVEN